MRTIICLTLIRLIFKVTADEYSDEIGNYSALVINAYNRLSISENNMNKINIPIFDSSDAYVGHVVHEVNRGEVVHHSLIGVWEAWNVTKELRYFYEDCISNYLYNIFYSPSRVTSTPQDQEARRSDVIGLLLASFPNRFQKYLEIGCYDDENFNVVKSLFVTSVCVDPNSGGGATA